MELRRALRPVVKDEELVGAERKLGVRFSLVVRELHLVHAVQEFHDSANLAP